MTDKLIALSSDMDRQEDVLVYERPNGATYKRRRPWRDYGPDAHHPIEGTDHRERPR